MTVCLTEEAVARYRAGRIDFGPELATLDAHLNACSVCRQALHAAVGGQARSLASRLAPDPHEPSCPEDDLLAQYVTGTADPIDLECLEAHLAFCQSCSEAVVELRELRVEVRKHDWGSRLAPEPRREQSAKLILRDGPAVVGLDERGRLSGLDWVTIALRRRIRAALHARRIPTAVYLPRLAPSGALLGASDRSTFTLEHPVGTVVESDRPKFRWSALEGTVAYTVTVTDASTLSTVFRSNPIPASQGSAREWPLPDSQAPLSPGRTYQWSVSAALRDGTEALAPGKLGSAKFRVLDRARARRLAAARETAGGSHLVLAVIYAEVGLMEEAERELLILVDANPGSMLALHLLESCRSNPATG